LLGEIDKLNDDNDLFMRAMNLAKLAEDNRASSGASVASVSHGTASTASSAVTRTPRGQNEAMVFNVLNSIIANGKMTNTLLSDLQTCAYSRANFNLSTFPMLVSEADFLKIGYSPCRYYRKTLKLHGTVYRVCSQWIPERIHKLEAWFKTL
jgi:hypothetical protein